MMKDPLTPREVDEFLESFVMQFKENYQRALNSGALNEEEVGSRGDHTAARCVLCLTAHSMKPVSTIGREALLNLAKLI